MMIDPRQVIAARGLLGWTQGQLAAKTEIGINTVKVFENSKAETRPVVKNAIKRTLEEHGIQFTNVPGRIGVSLAVDTA